MGTNTRSGAGQPTGADTGDSETMKSFATIADELRERIISEPDVILDDREVMRALIDANEKALGSNVFDLRGLAIDRLEARLGKLEDTHRSVIAAAYENLAGTNQMHRAVLRLLEPDTFEGFLTSLDSDVADILRVDAVRLAFESRDPADGRALTRLGDVITILPEGGIDAYLTRGRPVPVRLVTLRAVPEGGSTLYGAGGDWIRSEACIKLDLGPGRLPGLLAFGSEDPEQFTPAHGTDLLTFFSGVFERLLRRWLS